MPQGRHSDEQLYSTHQLIKAGTESAFDWSICCYRCWSSWCCTDCNWMEQLGQAGRSSYVQALLGFEPLTFACSVITITQCCYVYLVLHGEISFARS
jgi:hypothetical protein